MGRKSRKNELDDTFFPIGSQEDIGNIQYSALDILLWVIILTF